MFTNSPSSRPLILGCLAVALASGMALAQQPTSSVVDGAGMFSEDALRRARTDLAELHRAKGVAVTVETVTSLKGDSIDEAAIRRAERSGHKGVFVLIAEKEHKAEVLAAPRALFEELGKSRLNEIRDAFTAEFRKGNVDEGLAKGVKAAEKVLAAVRPSATTPAPAPSFPASSPTPHPTQSGGFMPTTPTTLGGSSSPLVLRQQVRLTLAGARKAIEGAEAKAIKEGWKMNIAVVDDGGHLIAFGRMDGARPASVATSTTKAVSAATYRQPTGRENGAGSINNPDVIHNLSIQVAALASGGKFTTLLGGVPIVVDDQVIGAIGVGGGSGEQDLEASKAGVAAFLEGLQAKPREVEAKVEEPKPRTKELEAESKPKGPETATTKSAEGDTTPK